MTSRTLLYGALGALQMFATAFGASLPEDAWLELPADWSLTPLVAPTQTMGLQVSSFIINASDSQVRDWRQRNMTTCRLPAASEEDDWHCVNERFIYSLLWREEGFIWVLSERIQDTPLSLNGLPVMGLADFNAQVISHSETAFESVTLLLSKRSLYGLQQDLQRSYRAQGAHLLLQEQDSGGFTQQWQHAEQRITYTAHKDNQGDVILVRVRGTNL